MKHPLPLALSVLSLALVACVDTTGLSAESSRPVHPTTSENAVVTVVEYADLQCPACRAAHTLLTQPLVSQYSTRISYEFRHFPLMSIHRYAMDAAQASECAADQGKFWEFVDMAYANQDSLSPQALDQWGQELGLDMDLYDRCRDSGIKRDLVQESYDEGREMGVSGTPTFFVNGERVESTIEALSAAIDQKLGSAGANL